MSELQVDIDRRTHVGTFSINRPPNNYIDAALIGALADAIDKASSQEAIRACVIRSIGKHFSAGRDLSIPRGPGETPADLYAAGLRIFQSPVPVVAAVQGAAIGGGLGLALMADFRIGATDSRFAATFARLGYHHGFGMSVTLPLLLGAQHTMRILYFGETIHGPEAKSLGLIDEVAAPAHLDEEASLWAAKIAASAPLAIAAIRQTLRGDLGQRIAAAMDREAEQQDRLRATRDFREGVDAVKNRRSPDFRGE